MMLSSPHQETLHRELAAEWRCLQQQYGQYEQQALLIKLSAVATVIFALAWPALMLPGLVLLSALWGQEAILRTQQQRLAERLQRVEASIREQAPAAPCQLHSDWLAQRGSSGKLLREYLQHGLRPTVAYPYAPLLLLIVICIFWGG